MFRIRATMLKVKSKNSCTIGSRRYDYMTSKRDKCPALKNRLLKEVGCSTDLMSR